MTTAQNFGSVLLIILAIDMMLMLGQVAVNEMTTDGTQYYNTSGALLGTEDQGNYTLSEITDISSILPTTQEAVTSGTEGNIFVETFKNIRNWFLDTTGLSYIIMFINAVPNFLKAIGFPPILVFSLGALWHIMTIFLAVSYIWGR
jgi:hypothetical protein